jgi:mannose-6-phosphate isomerase-like protein (cupin superfamily)
MQQIYLDHYSLMFFREYLSHVFPLEQSYTMTCGEIRSNFDWRALLLPLAPSSTTFFGLSLFGIGTRSPTIKEQSIFLLLHAAYALRVMRLDNIRSQHRSGYPEVITCLPEADLPFAGVKAWILQADTRQLIFFEFEADADVPEHSHGYAQWGMVIDGKMELTINGKPRICEKGDEYVIPAGAKHFARFLSRTRVMDFFSEKNRYKPKTIK